MTPSEKLQERRQVVDNAARGKKNTRVPTIANFWTWKILDSDSNVKILECHEDLSKMENLVLEFHDRYQFDVYQDLGTRNKFNVGMALGNLNYDVNDETGMINALDGNLMEDSEYDEYMSNPLLFKWQKVLPRRYGDLTYEQFRNGVKEMIKGNEYSNTINQKMMETRGVPMISEGGVWTSPVEELFSFGLRGFTKFSRDMRRQADKIDAYIDMKEPGVLSNVENTFKNPNGTGAYNIEACFLAHSCMSSKQFERFMFRTLKKVAELQVKYDATDYIFVEGSTLQIKDFFEEVKDAHITLGVEQDDIFEVRKQLPWASLGGGMPVELLGNGTVEQCVDCAKKLVEEMGDTNYVMSQNRMVSFRNDCKRENLLAVQEFVLNYRF